MPLKFTTKIRATETVLHLFISPAPVSARDKNRIAAAVLALALYPARRSLRMSPMRMVTFRLSKYSAKGMRYLRDTPVISLN